MFDVEMTTPRVRTDTCEYQHTVKGAGWRRQDHLSGSTRLSVVDGLGFCELGW